MTWHTFRSRFLALSSSSLLPWAFLSVLTLALALLPPSRLALALPLVLALLLAPLGPIAGLALAILSVPIQDVWQLPGGLSYTQAAMLLAVCGWGLSLLGHTARPIRAGRLFLPWLFFLWALLLATALTPFSIAEGIKETLRWAEAFAIWLMAMNLVQRRWHVAVLVTCLLLGPLAEALIGLAQFATGQGPPSFRIAAGLPYVRAYGTIGQPNSFAGYLNMAWPLALALAAGVTWWAWRAKRPSAAPIVRSALAAGLWLVTALLLAALLASLSRGAWLGAALGLLGMALALGGRARLAALAGISLGVLALALGGIGLLPGFVATRLTSIASYLTPFDASTVAITPANFAIVERMSQIQAGWRMLLAHPISGVGPGNFNSAYPAFAVGGWYVSRGHAHNYYVHIAAEAGLVGWAAYMIVLIGLACQARRTLRSVQSAIPRSIAIGCCGIIAAVVGHDLFENLHVLSMGVQLAAVWALLSILENLEQRPQKVIESKQSTGV